MNRSINLDSFKDIILDMKSQNTLKNFKNSLNNYNDITNKVQIDIDEMNVFLKLYTNIENYLTVSQKCGWFYSSKNREALNQEFDLLRFSENLTINLELKSYNNN